MLEARDDESSLEINSDFSQLSPKKPLVLQVDNRTGSHKVSSMKSPVNEPEGQTVQNSDEEEEYQTFSVISQEIKSPKMNK